ncbi:UNVERIFIED_CONTAM: hypothetical protein Q9R58_28060 [Methylobacteriaceae bacterium AG10]|nr:hypothetical protein [Methylobacteriaceae bacterium AG10]
MAVDHTAQIAAMEAALAQGVTSVSYEGKSASYRSLEEMIQTIAYLKRQDAKAAGRGRAVAGFAGFSRGYRTRGPGYGY